MSLQARLDALKERHAAWSCGSPTRTSDPARTATPSPGSRSRNCGVKEEMERLRTLHDRRSTAVSGRLVRRFFRLRRRRRRHGLTLPLQPLIRLRDGRVQVGLAAQAQDHRVARLDVGAVPVRALAHLLDRVLGGAEQLADLRFRQLRVVAQQEGDRVRTVVALGDRRVARTARSASAAAGRWAAASGARPDRPRSGGSPRRRAGRWRPDRSRRCPARPRHRRWPGLPAGASRRNRRSG